MLQKQLTKFGSSVVVHSHGMHLVIVHDLFAAISHNYHYYNALFFHRALYGQSLASHDFNACS